MLNREREPSRKTDGSKMAVKNFIPKKTVAFLGPSGTYSHLAAQEIFGNPKSSATHDVGVSKIDLPDISRSLVDYVAIPTIYDVFQKVEKGEVSCGVVPVENSIEGMVKDSINLFLNHKVIILKEFVLDIDHCLLSKGLYIQDVKVIRAHPQALGQCRKWLSVHLPRATHIATDSNTAGIANLSSSGKEAVIASQKIASMYELNVLAKHISDKENNKTLFYVITQNTNDFFNKETLADDVQRRIREDGAKKIIFLLEVVDGLGVLRDILSVFAEHNAPVSRIQSLPSGEIGVYYFLIDVDISKINEEIRGLYAKLTSQCENVRVLGVV